MDVRRRVERDRLAADVDVEARLAARSRLAELGLTLLEAHPASAGDAGPPSSTTWRAAGSGQLSGPLVRRAWPVLVARVFCDTDRWGCTASVIAADPDRRRRSDTTPLPRRAAARRRLRGVQTARDGEEPCAASTAVLAGPPDLQDAHAPHGGLPWPARSRPGRTSRSSFCRPSTPPIPRPTSSRRSPRTTSPAAPCRSSGHESSGCMRRLGDKAPRERARPRARSSPSSSTWRRRRPRRGRAAHPHESRRLYALAANLGNTVSTETLLDRGWGDDDDADPSYVWVTMRRLRQKIAARPGSSARPAHRPRHSATPALWRVPLGRRRDADVTRYTADDIGRGGAPRRMLCVFKVPPAQELATFRGEAQLPSATRLTLRARDGGASCPSRPSSAPTFALILTTPCRDPSAGARARDRYLARRRAAARRRAVRVTLGGELCAITWRFSVDRVTAWRGRGPRVHRRRRPDAARRVPRAPRGRPVAPQLGAAVAPEGCSSSITLDGLPIAIAGRAGGQLRGRCSAWSTGGPAVDPATVPVEEVVPGCGARSRSAELTVSRRDLGLVVGHLPATA